MEWTYLGHAGWHARAGALRLLFDPVLDDPHHGGTYAVWPPRRIDAAALRPDFVFVSHAHTDHFDVRSLAALARLDADTVVVTCDPLVAHVASRVGFRTVREVAPATSVELDGDVRVVLTPSHAPEVEWGAIVESDDGAVWNQVDTVLGSADEVRRVLAGARLGRPLALALARWAPLLEIEAQVPGSLAFPFTPYALILDLVAATEARAVVPSAAGQRHLGAAAWLDRITMPVSEARFLRDLAARAPGIRPMPARVGAMYAIRQGDALLEPEGGRALVEPRADPGPDPRRFRPLEVGPLRDRTPPDAGPELEGRLDHWITDTLAPALTRALSPMASDEPIRLLLSIVLPSGTRDFTLIVGESSCAVEDGDDGEHDVANVVSAGALAGVIDGARAWGDVLLAGELRASVRAYRIRDHRLQRLPIAPIFLYYALPYLESCRRAVLRELDAVQAGEPPPWAR